MALSSGTEKWSAALFLGLGHISRVRGKEYAQVIGFLLYRWIKMSLPVRNGGNEGCQVPPPLRALKTDEFRKGSIKVSRRFRRYARILLWQFST